MIPIILYRLRLALCGLCFPGRRIRVASVECGGSRWVIIHRFVLSTRKVVHSFIGCLGLFTISRGILDARVAKHIRLVSSLRIAKKEIANQCP